MTHKTPAHYGYLCGLGAVAIWSGFILVSRYGGLSTLQPYDVIAIRYLTCAALLLPIWWFYRRVRLFTPRLIVIGLIGGLLYALFVFQGFKTTPASHAAILLPGALPLFMAILAFWLNRQHQSRTVWMGIAVISLGMSILLWQQTNTSQGFSSGHAQIVAAALCWAIYSVLVARWQITPWQATFSLAFTTSIIYLPCYLLWLPKNILVTTWQEVALQAFYQGFLATIVQMLLYVRAVQQIGPTTLGAMMSMVPVVSGLSAIYLFDEPLTLELTLALTTVTLGLGILHSRALKHRLIALYRRNTHHPETGETDALHQYQNNR